MKKCENCISTLTGTNIAISPTDIIFEVCNYYDIYMTEVISKKRDFHLVGIRHKIYDLLYSNTDLKMSLKYIGSFFQGKDHTTIIHGINQVKKFCEVYPEYRNEYKKLHLKIYGSLKYFKH
jgi:chromosomal replication initiator protein